MCSDDITIVVDGVTVTGEIYGRKIHAVGVEILSPYCNLCNYSSFPLLGGRPGFDRRGPDGNVKAAELLEQLYHFGRFLDASLPEIRRRYAEFDAQEARDTAALLEPWYVQRRALKRRLKSGEISSKEHMVLLKPLQKQIAALRSSIADPRNTFRGFVDRTYGLCAALRLPRIIRGEVTYNVNNCTAPTTRNKDE
ncbi:hypothetical protein KKF84_22150 [Myxococcota bacterium]|nr:hypothetical protein [Myxococcota bacterium]MBU1538031.1 hypothetical protein [Myxococcota bacterium]